MMRWSGTAAWSRANRWWLALIVVIFFGYAIGKDMALRDNRADIVHAQMERR